MIREMQALFGEEFWQFTILGVSHWSYSNEAVANRNHSGESEQKFMAEWNSLLQKFHIDIELQGVFIDAFSQRPWIEDENQEAAFQRETAKLWDFAQQNGLFTFRTVGDVLEENQKLKDEIKWLNDVITNNISKLAESIAANSEEIAANSAEIVVNTEMIKENSEAISTNTDAIENALDSFETLPLGTILSWTPYPDKNTQNPSSIPPGWMLCDGSEITEGPWKGHQTPDINNSKRFLRGNIVGNALNTEDDSVNTDGLHVYDRAFHVDGCVDGARRIGGTGTGTCAGCHEDSYCEFTHGVYGDEDETRPINMNVVFIIKVNN